MFIPLELVREIIETALHSSTTATDDHDDPGVSTKQNWLSIQPLTLASKIYRELALEAWFQTFFIKMPSDINVLQDMFPRCFISVRELHCVQRFDRKTSVWDLNGLTHLRKIRLDWLSSVMPRFHMSEDQLPFTNVPPTVEELDIRGLPWPSPMILSSIRLILPNLGILRLRQHSIWCGLCHTCSFTGLRPPGTDKIVYEGGGGLPMYYARALYPLQNLHIVYLTIANFGNARSVLLSDVKKDPYLWAGECNRCMEIMYEDEAFRYRWIVKKRGAEAPPALKRVEWNFFKADGSEEDYISASGDEWSESEDHTQATANLNYNNHSELFTSASTTLHV